MADMDAYFKAVDEDNAAESKQKEQSSSSILSGISDTVSNISNMFNPTAEDREKLYDEAIEETNDIYRNPEGYEENPGTGDWQDAKNKEARKNFVQLVDEAAEDPNGYDLPRDLRASEVYQNYFLIEPERISKAQDIEKVTGIPAGAILKDTKAYKNALGVYDYIKKQKAAVGDSAFSLEEVYKRYPELKSISGMNEQQVATVLHDIGSVREFHNIFSDNKSLWEQYTDYAAAVWKQGKLVSAEGRAWNKVKESKDGRQGRAEAEAITKQLEEQSLQGPNMFDDPLKALIFYSGTSFPDMLYSQVEGGIGAALGGAAGVTAGALAVGIGGTVGLPVAGATATVAGLGVLGAKAGFWTGNVYGMSKSMAGQEYKELSQKRDKSGKEIYTHKEKKATADVVGPLQGIAEVASMGAMVKMFVPKDKLFAQGFRQAVKEFAEEAAAAKSVKNLALQAAKKELPAAVKNPVIGAVGEFTDEFVQSYTQDIAENELKAETGRGGRLLTNHEMFVKAVNSGYYALPGGAGFGVGSLPFHAASSVTGLGVRINKQLDFQNKYTDEARHTIIGANLLSNLQQAIRNSKMSESDAELQRKIIREQAKGTTFEMVYIDTESVLKKENGIEQLRKIGEAAGFDDAAIQTAVDQGMMAVPVESFAQSQADNNILTSVSFDEQEASIAELARNAEEIAKAQAKIEEEARRDIERVKNAIIKQYFPDDADAADMAIIAMYDNPNNPTAGLRGIERQILEAKMSLIQPALDVLNRVMNNGVDIIQGDDGRGIRVSNNEQWYQDFYADFGRAPTKAELIEMAQKLMTGESGAPIIDGWILDEQAYKDAGDLRQQLQDFDTELEIVRRAKEKMSDFSSSEMKNVIGLTEEAFSVYRAIKDKLSTSPGTSPRAARLNAIIFARHADRFAQLYTEKSGRKFTALDYYNNVKIAFDGQAQPGALNQMAGVNAKNAPLDKLEQAKAMQKEGKSTKEIWRETGWIQGNDAKWRFEIPDDIDSMNVEKLYEAGSMRLEDFYDNPRLYEAYPFLKDVTIEVKRLPKTLNGRWFDDLKLIEIRKGFIGHDIRNDGLQTNLTIVHEIQHAIQDREGFARGGSVATVRGMLQNVLARLKGLNVSLTEDEKGYLGVKNSLFEYLLGNKKMTENQLELNQSMLEEYAEKIPEERREEIELNRSRTETIEKLLAENISDEELYRRLAGEMEARETSERAMFGLNWMVPNINDDDAIVVFGEREYGAASMELNQINAADMEAVRKQYEGTDKWMKAPNGKQTNLNEQQWLAVRTPKFKAWFGDWENNPENASKVVDENGEPLVVYHGTNSQWSIYDSSQKNDNHNTKANDGNIYTSTSAKVAESYLDYNYIDYDKLTQEQKKSVENTDLTNKVKLFVKVIINRKEMMLEVSENGSLTGNLLDGNKVIHYGKNITKTVKEKAETAEKYSFYKSKTDDTWYKTYRSDKNAVELANREKYFIWLKHNYSSDSNVMNLFSNVRNPLVVDYKGNNFRKSITVKGISFDSDEEKSSLAKIEQYAKDNGYDGVIANGIVDIGNELESPNDETATTVVMFSPNQIKSAANNNGNYSLNDDNIYHQEKLGEISLMSDGSRLIQLFENANESTFLHEMGHLFLMDLEELATVDPESQKQLEIVRDWAAWKKGDYKLYKGTPWEKEFADSEQAIIDAEQNGDFEYAEKLKKKWIHERFARAFEIYLREGKAPSKGLRAVFRSFAKFLRQIYSAFVSDGARASKEVERIMGMMIATDEEIEAMAMDDQFRDFEKAGGEKLLNETERETYQRWLDEAKEEAREKLHKEIWAELEKKFDDEFQEYFKQEMQAARQRLEQEPVNLAREIIKRMGGDKNAAVPIFPTVEAFENADANTLGIEQALKEEEAMLMKDYEDTVAFGKTNEEAVRQAMATTKAHKRAKELEAAALARKLDAKRKINARAEQAMRGLQDALDAMPDHLDLQADKQSDAVKKIHAKINELRFSTKWSAKDFAEIDKMIKAATKEQLEQQLKAFEENTKKQKLNLKAVEQANEGRLKLYRELARDAIGKQQIFNATNVNEHRKKQREAERNVQRMIKAGRIDMAIQQQQAAALSAAMANEAQKAKEKVEKMVAAINRQLSAKSTKLPAKERYWHRHLAWLLRIGEAKDPEKPVLKNGQKLGSLGDLIKGYQQRLDLAEDYDVDDIVDIIERNAQLGYKGMTIDEFQKAMELMGIIYKCGKDEFSLKTIAGKTIDEAVTEIMNEASLADKMSITRKRIQDNTGGIGWNDFAEKIPVMGEGVAKLGQGYLSIGLKPEKIIELLGKKAHKYIYGTLDRAANDEAEMMSKAIQDIQAMLADFSHKERMSWKDMDYEFLLPTKEGGTEVVRCSKENIICMALNLGTETNRQRLVGGFFGVEAGESDEQRQAAAQGHLNFFIDLCSRNLTKKDWQLVQSIWDYLDTFWADTARVEEELNGQHLEKQKAVGFAVQTTDNEVVHLRGGYYPIRYNPDKDENAAAHAADDVAKQSGGSQKVLGTGRSHVKARSEADVFRELGLKFDTIPAHIQQVIHNITHRLAARDVFRLINNSMMSEYIEDHLGAPYRDMLRQWSLDCWTQLPEKDSAGNFFEKTFAALRSNSTFAIMAYRFWPALENLSNIGPVADRLGYINALTGIFEFYGHIGDFRKLMDKSTLMRNRINNLDRDIRSQGGLFTAENKVIEVLKEHGYDMMTYSDLMFSAPLWCRAYKENFMQMYQETVNENNENKKKVQKAQDELDKLRGALADAKKDVQDWQDEKRNRAKAGQAGWQPGTSRFAVMGGIQFSTLLPELQNKVDVLKEKIWHAEAEFGHAVEIKILQGNELVQEAERRAVEKADAAVRDAFGSGRTIDLAAVSRTSSELAKSMTTFYSFFNTQFNALFFKYLEGKYGSERDAGTWNNMKAWLPFAKGVMNRIIITSLIGSLLKMATKTDGDSDRDKWKKVKNAEGKMVDKEIPWLERFLKVFAKNSLSMTFGAFYGIRDIGNLALNLAFDGTDFGRGVNFVSTPLRSLEEGIKTVKLIAAKSEKDLQIDEKQAADAEKYRKMNKKQRARYDENQKYKKPVHRITYAEIFRHGANALTGLTAAKTGVSSTVIDSITGTMQYMLDTDNRYDANWRNVIWSALFDKKPVEREVPRKPPAKPKNKRRKNKR